MGMLDDVKRMSKKAKELVAKNDVKVKEALDKAAGVVDQKTKGKYSDKIGGAVTKAKEAVDKLPDQPGKPAPPAQAETPAPPPPPAAAETPAPPPPPAPEAGPS